VGTKEKVRFSASKPRTRIASENLTSGGEEVHEITKERRWRKKKSRKSRSPSSSTSHENQSKMKKSPFESGIKPKKSKKRKSGRRSTSPSATGHEEKGTKRRSFFGFGLGKSKSRGRKSKTPEMTNEKKIVRETIGAEKAAGVESSNGGFTPLGDPWNEDARSSTFSRNQPTRRSAREIIAEMEARSKNTELETKNGVIERKNSANSDVPRRKPANLPATGKPAHGERKTSAQSTTGDLGVQTPPSKQSKNENLWQELSR
jgi:hypothetical protein